ncbi:MAG: GMC family oxidoreductase, partial [Planctomycetes bacterium]|nr:GMC family oxidoreductase [Planctomycetota bacterium]
KNAGLTLCVLESGRRRTTRHHDQLRHVECEGIRIKEYSRERVLGGASTTWSGLSSPLDPADFRVRGHVPNSGWPLSLDALTPFYEQASDRYRFPPLSLFRGEGLEKIREKGDFQLRWEEVEEKIFMAAAEAQHFGREFGHIFHGEGPDLYLDATVLRLEGRKEGDRIDCAVIRNRNGREFRLRAKVFVVAAGGIENARLLLNSKDLCPQGLGNEHDQVGRYLMNHPKNYYGTLRMKKPLHHLPYYLGCMYRDFAGYAGLRLREEIQEEKKLLNSYVRFEPLFPWSDNRGVEALVLLVKRSKLMLKSFKNWKKGKVVSVRDYSETGDDSDFLNRRKTARDWIRLPFTVLVNLVPVITYLYFRVREKANPRIKTVRLRNFMEMEPDPENRVTLSKEKDAYGQPVPRVTHRPSDLDKRSLIALHEAMKKEAARNGLGDLKTNLAAENPWPVDLDASHHMGTTRMGEDPRTSVVNSDCRLHSVDNLYVAGASVFPTSGCANPTFTLVALAIRLARHLEAHVFPSMKKVSRHA